jgi:hypothetical protein
MVLSAGTLCAQPVIGAKAGVVSYAVGRVTVDGHAIEVTGTRFPEVKERSVLRTGRGLAEMLLGPCSAVRLGQHSSFRLLVSDPVHPRVELLSGAAIVDITGMARESDVTLQAGGAAVAMARAGVYRIDLSPGMLKVFNGRATLQREGRGYDVGPGHVWSLLGAAAGKFDRQPADELDRWSGRRGVELAQSRPGPGKSGGPSVDLLNNENNAEFARAGGGRRGMPQNADGSPMIRNGPHRTTLSSCVAGR